MTQQQDETRARFVAAIANRVNPDAIAEVHLFQPIKQGAIESGVAVVAVEEGLGPVHGDSREPRSESSEPRGENRLAVYTAKYRLTLKGPDRGKWDFAMNAQADAPLITVDVVVRGVQNRSGDAEDPLKLTGAEFREMLPPPVTSD